MLRSVSTTAIGRIVNGGILPISGRDCPMKSDGPCPFFTHRPLSTKVYIKMFNILGRRRFFFKLNLGGRRYVIDKRRAVEVQQGGYAKEMRSGVFWGGWYRRMAGKLVTAATHVPGACRTDIRHFLCDGTIPHGGDWTACLISAASERYPEGGLWIKYPGDL